MEQQVHSDIAEGLYRGLYLFDIIVLTFWYIFILSWREKSQSSRKMQVKRKYHQIKVKI